MKQLALFLILMLAGCAYQGPVEVYPSDRPELARHCLTADTEGCALIDRGVCKIYIWEETKIWDRVYAHELGHCQTWQVMGKRL